ncbi:MAG: FkbM family methyltransferase [Proteobacteria bacterium]|nr:FkbM family methyltransferase [Pseudomonadota bacterium]
MPKSFFKRVIRRLGFDLRRYRPGSTDDAQFIAMLVIHRINLILDVGANRGQFGRQLRDAGYKGRIVSFEPLAAAHEALALASEKDPLWEVAPQAAIGSENGEIEIHVAGNSESSSVLNMLDSHAAAAPESVYVGSERVPLRRLDDLAQGYLQQDSILFVKIDTQGYEDRVLQGAPNILARAVGLQLELSLVPLYEGQRLYDEMVDELKALNFELWGVTPTFVDPESGRLLQIDATFFRR